jgi:predicted RNase H-like nuclease (RuvC/YqgF family)
VILGLDPGTTVGLAVLDLRGNLLHLSSRRSATDSWILNIIRRYGAPIIVAADVAHPPERVRRIASQFGARLWYPPQDILEKEKDAIAAKFSHILSKIDDAHQRDALVAAYLAYLDFAPKFRQVEKRVGDNRELEEFVKRSVVLGKSMAQAVSEFERQSVEGHRTEDKEKRSAKSSPSRTEVSELLAKIANLKAELRAARAEVMKLREERARLEDELRRARRFRLPPDEAVAKLRMERDHAKEQLRDARRNLNRLRRALHGVAEGKYVVRVCDPGDGRVIVKLGDVYVVEPKPKEEDAEDVISRIQRLVEEYRASRRKGRF